MMKSIVATVSLISQNGPNTCVTYFNFTDTQQSNTYYGLANNDGTITQLANLGYREDPQGRITVGKDYFTFTVLGGKGTGWGCCDELTTLTTNKTDGTFNLASLNPSGPYGPGSKLCGKYGCGIAQFAGVDDISKTTLAWMDPLLPQPPPKKLPNQVVNPFKKVHAASGSTMGLQLGTFDLTTADFTPLVPFQVDYNNATSSTPLDSGMTGLDTANNKFWFSCTPHGDNTYEGVCSVPLTKSNEQPTVTTYAWSNTAYQISSMDYSKALKGAIVLGQKIPTSPAGQKKTKQYTSLVCRRIKT